jgi:hypothetical protein
MFGFQKIATILLAVCSTAVPGLAQPTITGVNAFWYLGGILYDGAGCTTNPPGPCYYAEAAWTANANGASGTPTWHAVPTAGGANVTFSCNPCTNNVATSIAPSNGCTYDLTVYLSYPDGSQSDNFYVEILVPNTTTQQSITQTALNPGYISTYSWSLTDSCGYSDAGLDGNEVFGSFVNDTSNDWSIGGANAIYNPTNIWQDQIGHQGGTPSAQNPGSGTTKIRHDYPWTLYVGSQTHGSGTPIRADTQQWWRDHGSHF